MTHSPYLLKFAIAPWVWLSLPPPSTAMSAIALPCTDTVRSGHTGTNLAPPCTNQGQIHLGYTYMHHNRGNRSSPIDTSHNWSHENRADMCKHHLWDRTAERLILLWCSCTAGKQQECTCTQHMLQKEAAKTKRGIWDYAQCQHVCKCVMIFPWGRKLVIFFFFDIIRISCKVDSKLFCINNNIKKKEERMTYLCWTTKFLHVVIFPLDKILCLQHWQLQSFYWQASSPWKNSVEALTANISIKQKHKSIYKSRLSN